MDQQPLKKLEVIWSVVCLSKPYYFEFFKGSPPQILLGPFLNTLTNTVKQMKYIPDRNKNAFSKNKNKFAQELTKNTTK